MTCSDAVSVRVVDHVSSLSGTRMSWGLYTMVNPSPAATMTTGLLASVDAFLNEIEFADLFGEGQDWPAGRSRGRSAEGACKWRGTAVVTLKVQGFGLLPTHTGVYQQEVTAWTPWDITLRGRYVYGYTRAFQASGDAGGHDIKQALDVAAKAAARYH